MLISSAIISNLIILFNFCECVEDAWLDPEKQLLAFIVQSSKTLALRNCNILYFPLMLERYAVVAFVVSEYSTKTVATSSAKQLTYSFVL